MTSVRRLPTPLGKAAPAAGPVGLTTQLNVAARPVTSGGLMAPSTALGPRRQIADRSYYVQELRSKIADISNEVESLKKESAGYEQGNALYKKLERTYDTTIQDVRQLEGELADFNLALDKLRTNTDVQDIRDMHAHVKQQNDAERQQIDATFLKRQEIEKQTEELEAGVQAILQQAAIAVSSLGPESEQEYQQLRGHTMKLSQLIAEKENNVIELEARVRIMQKRLQSDSFRLHLRGLEARRKYDRMREEHEELVQQTTQNLSPEQMRERLLEKVKQDTADIKSAEQRISQLEDTLENMQELRREREDQVNSFHANQAKNKKLEALYAREKKIQNFLDNFHRTQATEQKKKTKLQLTNAALLQSISRELQQNNGSTQQLAGLKRQLSFKEKTESTSEQTVQGLQKEIAAKKKELQTVDGLEAKIATELSMFDERATAMREEMDSFLAPDELRMKAQHRHQELKQMQVESRAQLSELKRQVDALKHQYDRELQHVQGHPDMKTLEALQNKLRTYAQKVNSLKDHVESHERDTEYESLKTSAMALLKQINTNVSDMRNMQPLI
jgi:intraflagellar transport protein 74